MMSSGILKDVEAYRKKWSKWSSLPKKQPFSQAEFREIQIVTVEICGLVHPKYEQYFCCLPSSLVHNSHIGISLRGLRDKNYEFTYPNWNDWIWPRPQYRRWFKNPKKITTPIQLSLFQSVLQIEMTINQAEDLGHAIH